MINMTVFYAVVRVRAPASWEKAVPTSGTEHSSGRVTTAHPCGNMGGPKRHKPSPRLTEGRTSRDEGDPAAGSATVAGESAAAEKQIPSVRGRNSVRP